MHAGFPLTARDFLVEMMPTFSGGADVEVRHIGDGTFRVRNVIIPWRPSLLLVAAAARTVVLPYALNRVGLTDASRDQGLIKLFARRVTAAKTRELKNQEEVERWFVDRGYTAVDPGALSLTEQIVLFSRATHVAAPEGAALTNMIYGVCVQRIITITSPMVRNESFSRPSPKLAGYRLKSFLEKLSARKNTQR